ncbi:MAG: SCP2 sterol-binding domain-containing protein [Actinomycetota bacterium]|nr:SCP2 sterol-binding domain-containing protein [Actinomycetota bacterium]
MEIQAEWGVIRFLSPEWLAALAAAASANERLCQAVTGIDLTVRQVVLGGPGGDVAYSLRLVHGTATVTTGDDDDADVRIVQDYDTAASISNGDITPAAAFAAGRLKLGGRVDQLIRHADVAAGLDDLFGSLRAATSY